jgi:hypothetical protein
MFLEWLNPNATTGGKLYWGDSEGKSQWAKDSTFEHTNPSNRLFLNPTSVKEQW